SDVSTTGEDTGSGAPSLPVVHYDYGAVTAGGSATAGTVSVGAPFSVLRAYGGSTSMYGDGISETEVTHVQASPSHAVGAPPPWPGQLEYTATRHVIRDFTGDGIPDLVFRDANATWHLVPGHVRDDVELYGNDYTWTDFPEIFQQVTYEPPSDTPDERSIMTTTMTLVEFVDWNGDGLMDVVDMRGTTH